MTGLTADAASRRHHLIGAIDWIQRAHAMAGDGGISKGYDVLRRRWAPSYPETTGYTIPTLLNAARALERPELGELACSLADYLMARSSPEGGVAHWQMRAEPIVFDTGQVVFGWIAASEVTRRADFLDAAVRAADWLVAVQDESGSWKRHQYRHVEKVIDTRVAWALLELHRRTGRETYRNAAVRNVRWALRQQDADGWFRRCGFTEGADPFTHTLAYTAEGLVECGWLLEDAGLIDAARCTADALLVCQRPDGRLASSYGPEWRETSRSTCLTGNCQMARVWMRLGEACHDPTYRLAAEKALDFVAATQKLGASSLDVRGGIAGSRPIFGRYERFKYPNWAAKFFADALLEMVRADNGGSPAYYAG